MPGNPRPIATGATLSIEDDWRSIAGELDAWQRLGRVATFWWRDDDAITATPALDRLLDLTGRHRAPLCIAAIPAACDGELARALDDTPGATVFQHGHAHVDLSPGFLPGCAELQTELPDGVMVKRLGEGRDRLAGLFRERFAPVLVPPWNRIGDRLRDRLPAMGYRGLSTFGARHAARPVDGLVQINAHCDIVDWKRGGRFRGRGRSLGDLVEHLRGRRSGAVDAQEPTGILTHHLDHDQDCWRFLGALLDLLDAHPAARIVGRETFGA